MLYHETLVHRMFPFYQASHLQYITISTESLKLSTPSLLQEIVGLCSILILVT